MISQDQGEVGIVFESDPDTGEVYVTHAVFPNEETFGREELQMAFVQAAYAKPDILSEEDLAAREVFLQQLQELREGKAQKITRAELNQMIPEGSAQDKKVKAKAQGVLTGTKYKRVADKIRPVLGHLDEQFRIVRNIIGDSLEKLPELPTQPREFEPTGRYTEERKKGIDKMHPEGFLWPEEAGCWGIQAIKLVLQIKMVLCPQERRRESQVGA